MEYTAGKGTTALGVVGTVLGSMGQSVVRTSIHQYGSYVEISDVLETHHVDNTMLGASEELGAQHGQTEDLLVRNALSTGTNIMFCDVMDDADKYVKTPQTRWQMEGKAFFTPATCAKIRTKMVKEKHPFDEGMPCRKGIEE